MSNHLHIISFDIPYPPDYGGVIDVFYKIKSLRESGFRISLHCFRYSRREAHELEKICEHVYYYSRKTGLVSNMHFLPYIIYSRRSSELVRNLRKDKDPLIFEGLHSSYYLKHKDFKKRLKIVRAHNVEHLYYFKLAGSEKGLRKKTFFLIEGIKLFFAEKRLNHANYIAAISKKELEYFSRKFKNVFLLNAFHSNEKVDIIPGKGDYLLYHGNLSVAENINAVNFLLENVFNKIDFKIIVAGKDPSGSLSKKINKSDNITLISSPGPEEMKSLIRNAQANILVSFQETGLKLKLIESLFTGRHCIANKKITGDSELIDLCETANTAAEIVIQTKKIIDSEFSEDQIAFRKKVLSIYENVQNARLLAEKISAFNSGD